MFLMFAILNLTFNILLPKVWKLHIKWLKSICRGWTSTSPSSWKLPELKRWTQLWSQASCPERRGLDRVDQGSLMAGEIMAMPLDLCRYAGLLKQHTSNAFMCGESDTSILKYQLKIQRFSSRFFCNCIIMPVGAEMYRVAPNIVIVPPYITKCCSNTWDTWQMMCDAILFRLTNVTTVQWENGTVRSTSSKLLIF